MANAYDQGFLRDPSGALVVTGGGSGGGSDPLSDGTDGGSLPTQTLWVAGKDGSILRGIQVDSGGRQVTRLGDGTNTAEILATPPASDTGQSGLAVRVISQLGAGSGGGGGGAVTQSTGAGAAAPWSMRLTDGTSFYDARTIRALTSGDTVTIANPTTNPETGLAKDATLTARLPAALDADGGLKIHVQNTSLAVTGTFWQATQPVSGPLTDTQLRASAVPVDSELTTADLDTGAGTDTRAVVGLARAESGGAVLVGSANPLPTTGPLTDTQLRASVVPVSVPGSVAVTGTFWQATQPVSGTVTISNPTTNPETGLAKDATLTGGTAKAIVRSATKGTSTAADVTSDATDANTQALHVNLKGTQATVPVTGTFFQATQPVSGTVTADTELPAAAAMADGVANPTLPSVGSFGALWNTATWDRTFSASGRPDGNTGAGTFPSPVYVFNGTTFDRVRGNTSIGMQVGQTSSPLVVSATAAVSTGVTATLAAVAGQFHYITLITISQISSTTAGAAGAPLTVTTTNLPGTLTWTRPTLVAGGDVKELVLPFASPLKSSVVNTATTIVAPVHTNIIWRINVHYYTAP
jgi:hypothetical protein